MNSDQILGGPIVLYEAIPADETAILVPVVHRGATLVFVTCDPNNLCVRLQLLNVSLEFGRYLNPVSAGLAKQSVVLRLECLIEAGQANGVSARQEYSLFVE